MAMSSTIRQYHAEDREHCRALWRELTEWHREIYEDPNIGGEHPEDYFDKHLSIVGPDNLWVAVKGFTVVGLVGLMAGESETEVEVEPLIVSKTYRGKGIGKQLINHVKDEAHQRGVRYIKIKPVARNTQTIAFLYKQGFRNLACIELFTDLKGQTWKPGPKIFGCDFDY